MGFAALHLPSVCSPGDRQWVELPLPYSSSSLHLLVHVLPEEKLILALMSLSQRQAHVVP